MAQRTLLKTVQTVVAALGEQPPSTVVNPNETTKVAVGAVNDALADIYSRARWDFRLKQYAITLAEGMRFPLPDDFAELHTLFLPTSGGQRHITFIEYQDLMAQHPDYLLLMDNDHVDNGTLALALNSIEFVTDNLGTPEYFTIHGNNLILWPGGDADWVASQVQLLLPYYCLAPELASDSDPLPLPPNLWPGATYLAQAFTKQYIESPDYQIDERRAERMIQLQLSRKQRRTGAPLRFRVRAC